MFKIPKYGVINLNTKPILYRVTPGIKLTSFDWFLLGTGEVDRGDLGLNIL